MRSVLLAVVAALVFASSAPPAWAAAEAPPTTGKTDTAEAGEAQIAIVRLEETNRMKWVYIGMAAAAVALVGVLAARWSKGGTAPTTPPAA